MENKFYSKVYRSGLFYTLALLACLLPSQIQAQCTAESGKIKGYSYIDYNHNGSFDAGDESLGGVLVSAYDQDHNLAAFATSSSNGAYVLNGLQDGTTYRISFSYGLQFRPSVIGKDNKSTVQFVSAPACSASVALIDIQSLCSENPEIVTSCFVQGPTAGSNVETLIGFEYNFNSASKVKKYAAHKETGSVWGVAYKSNSSEIFSAAFVKQYGGLTAHGPGAIFRTRISSNGSASTSLFVDLAQSVGVGSLSTTNIDDCAYGANVGKVGLGALVLSPDQDYLYVTNLGRKSLVRVSTANPDEVEEYEIPDPGCSHDQYVPFALKYYKDKLYIGITCTAETAKSAGESKAIVYEWSPSTPTTFRQIFETSYIKGFWKDTPSNDTKTQHWFTDIDFTDGGQMIIGLTDRIGHRYCKDDNRRLDIQSPDILMVYKNQAGAWVLENNGRAGSLIGSGVGNGQGPGGGEFFAHEFWVSNPTYHPETALGSFFVLPGAGSVVAAVYDPSVNAYSGGFHRYSTTNGSKEGMIELYSRNPTVLFGKATGFGDADVRCGAAPIEIGNFVWDDKDGDGVQDPGEKGISGMTLNLLDDRCNVVATTVTDINGNYTFSGIQGNKQYYLALPASDIDAYGYIHVGGKDYQLTSMLSGTELDDNNAAIVDLDCGKVIVPVSTGYTNHSFDIGIVKPSGFDLALMKELLNGGIARINDVLTFRITVYNQGGIPAANIRVIDYIPTGYEFLPAENDKWVYDGQNATTVLPGILNPGASASALIRLKLIDSDLNNLVNIAEIESATDHNGNEIEDEDSTPDNDMHNDTGGNPNTDTDDNITDNGDLDEDDSDPAVPVIFDLALKQFFNGDQCVTGGSEITINIQVFNQGNLAASSFEITNYGSPIFEFDKLKNPGWTKSGDVFIYKGGYLAPKSQETIELIFTILNTSNDDEVINYAEISSSIPEGRSKSEDSDSVPDSDPDNDAGGKVNTSDDNNIFGMYGVEEDDHDPISIHSRYVDLALIIMADKRRVYEGDEVCFEIEVYNQGQMPVKGIEIVDYLPAQLIMHTGYGWEKVGNNYIKEIFFNGSLTPGQTHVETFCTTVGNLEGHYSIDNFAEIFTITGMCDEDLSESDIDSHADDIIDNDPGGRALTNTDNTINLAPEVDEDDHDSAQLVHIEAVPAGPCVCLNNATEPKNGQYEETIIVKAPAGLVFTVDQAINFYTTTSPAPPADPDPMPVGTVLSENMINAFESEYSITGRYISGHDFQVRFRSDADDFEYYYGSACTYTSKLVDGPRALCDGGIATYSIPSNGVPSYTVNVTGGALMSTSNNGATAVVDWNTLNPNKEVRFTNNSGTACEDPAVLKVVTGNADIAMSCRSTINLSLDTDCEVLITPKLIIAGAPVAGAAYAVMLTNPDGSPNLTNIVDASHIGKSLMVKLIEGCSGNSCWGTIYVEDKIKPTILCEDVTVSCYKVNEYTGPVALDNCGDPVTLHILDSLYLPLQCDDFSGTFWKRYQAEDGSGNKSAVCDQTIYIKSIDLADIQFPKNMKMANALDCGGDYDKDANGHPHPSETGVPTLFGEDIYPEFDEFCNLTVSYIDEDPIVLDCVTKIIRKWIVFDGTCIPRHDMRMAEQILIIADTENPTLTCPEPKTASAGLAGCEAPFVLLPATNFADDCSQGFEVDVTYPGGFLDNQNGGKLVHLPVGVQIITYTVYDDCGKSNSCSTTVTVSDKTPPFAICDKNTTVALRSDGTAYLYAATIDDGSYDACGLGQMEVRRMDQGSNCGVTTPDFAPTVDFCCEDVDPTTPVIVEFRVHDVNGNSNTCMVNVFVQDKTKPTISCPDRQEISCEYHYDLKDLSEFGTATYQDACGATLTELDPVVEIDQCRVGHIERTFMVDDGSNQVTCKQRIYVVNYDPFDINSITMPLDYEVSNTCSAEDLEPDNLPAPYNKPTFDDGICDLVAATYKDKKYAFTDTLGTCFKIIRRWTVINYCMIDEPNYQPIEFDQVIKVSNTEPPSIISDLSDIVAYLNPGSCEFGDVTLTATGTDKCTPDGELVWSYQVFVNGSNTPYVSDSGKGPKMNASGPYPLGDHYILWSYEDRCGNVESKQQNFSVQDNKKPTAGCLESVSISLVPMDVDLDGTPEIEMACIGPDSLNASSSHPCLPVSDLTFSFDSLGTLNELCFDCFDLGVNVIDFYVIDPFGNFDVCKVKVDVQDNNNVDICPNLEECITWPDDVEIDDCNQGTTPAELGSMPVIDPLCECDEFDPPSFVDTPVSYPNPTCAIIDRLWTVNFTCGVEDKTFTYTQTIIRYNVVAPTISCPADVTIDANDDCEAEVNLADAVVSDDACNTGVMVSNNSAFANAAGANASGDYPEGVHTVTFTVVDGCANSSSCQTVISVIDNDPPVMVCNDITVNLIGSTYTLTQANINAITSGSSDNCNLSITVNPVQFDCDDAGEDVEVLVTGTDGNLSDQCTADVTVIDALDPTAVCNNITVALDGTGNVTLSQAQINQIGAGSSDNCDITLEVNQTAFNCSDVGNNQVTLTVTDDFGNTDDCTAIVTVEDNTDPIALCSNLTVVLDATGNYTLTMNDINLIGGASSDECGVTLSANPNTFDCTDVGNVSVTITATDPSGNTDDCTATVTVEDNTAPTAVCSDITVMLNAMGMYSLTPADLAAMTAGSSDACTFTISADPNMFDCDDVGNPVSVTVTLTDPSANSSQCVSTVTVEDDPSPTVVCNDIDIFLDDTGNYTLTMADSMAIVEGSSGNCGLTITFDPVSFDCDDTDTPVDITVTVTDLSGNTTTCVSEATVIDNIPPTAVCNNIVRNLDANGNLVLNQNDFNFISVGSSDNCDFDYIVAPINFDCDDVGAQTVTLTVTDDSGNTDTCNATVTINDNLPPTAVCNDITITLNGSMDYVLTPADSAAIVNGSSDNCGFLAAIDPNVYTCSDTISVVVATVILIDPSGNSSNCTANVTVVDNPVLTCMAQDITVSLNSDGTAYILPEDIDNGSGAGCSSGIITLDVDVDSVICNDISNSPITVTLTVSIPGDTVSCTAQVTIQDTIPPVITCFPDTTIACDVFDGDLLNIPGATADDNCQLISFDTLVIDGRNNCDIGIITRTFTVTDIDNNTDVCTQIIEITPANDPVDFDDLTLPPDTVFVDNCSSIAPEDIGGPVELTNPNGFPCDDIQISFADNPPTPPGMCIDTITRTWSIIDTCNSVNLSYVQTIIIEDTIAPVLSIAVDTVFNSNPNNECEVFVDLSGQVSVEDCGSGTTFTNNSPFADNNNSTDASGTYPFGTYDIQVTAVDACGNTDTIDYVLVIEEAVYVFACNKVIAAIDTVTLMACVAIEDAASVTGYCDTTAIIGLYDVDFDTLYTDTIKFDCSRLGDNRFLVYLIDNGVVVDSCTFISSGGGTLITILDPFMACNTIISRVSGKVNTYNDQPVRHTVMELEGSNMPYEMTNDKGEFQFPEMPSGGHYMLKPKKEDGLLEGVSTLDMIFIQRHILGLEALPNPYYKIAADVNNDGRITTSDIVALRKALLGLETSFPNNRSWKMLDAEYEFPVQSDPFAEPYPLYKEFAPLAGHRLANFTGIKIGDVNGSFKPAPNQKGNATPRSAVSLTAKDGFVSEGQTTSMDLTIPAGHSYFGAQYGIQIKGLKALKEVLHTGSTGFDYHIVGETIYFTFYGSEPVSSDQFGVTLEFATTSGGKLSDIISINQQRFDSEIYGAGFSVQPIVLEWTPDDVFQLNFGQINPNPWTDNTQIAFDLPANGQVLYNISDVAGKIIYTGLKDGVKGENQIVINASDVQYRNGVFIVNIEYKGLNLQRKMIRLTK